MILNDRVNMKILCTWLILQTAAALLTAQRPMVLFPGDANNDGACNHYDLLPIGIQYFKEFAPRDVQSIDWLPQLFLSWPDSLPVSLINAGFADCNGDGFVDDFDLDAIKLNYEKNQNTADPPPAPWLPKLKDTLFSTAQVLVELSFDRDTAASGDTVSALLISDIAENHPTGALGLALWLEYDASLVKDLETKIEPDTARRDLMFVTATPSTVDIWRTVPPGNIQFSVAGRAENVLKDRDTLAKISIIIEDKIFADVAPFTFDCLEFLMLNGREQVLPAFMKKDTLIIKKRTSSLAETAFAFDKIKLLPNPFTDFILVENQMHAPCLLTFFDLSGNLIFEKNMSGGKEIFDLPALAPGNYLARLQSGNEVVWRKMVKVD